MASEEIAAETAKGVTKVPDADHVTVILGTVGFGGGSLEKLAGMTRAVVGIKDVASIVKPIEDEGCEKNT